MNEAKRITFIVLGSLCLVLGAIGVFVPLLPTTPFWLLTCWFYLRSSDTLYAKMMGNRYFGSYMQDFMIDKSVLLRNKIISIAVMWTSALFTSFYLTEAIWIKILLLVISIGVTWHVLSFPTKKNPKK